MKKKVVVLDIILLIVIAVVLGVSMVWSRDIELELGLLYYVDAGAVDSDEIVELSADGAEGENGGALKVHYLDVGQGDCTVIDFPDGKTMIIDAGKGYNSVKTAITTFIDENYGADFKYFDYAILTHPDDDHCGSMGYVLENYPAKVCYRPNVEATAKGYTDPAGVLPKGKETASYKTAIEAMYTEVDGTPSVVYITDPSDEEQTITGGTGEDAYSFTFYSPLSEKYTDWNDYSPIMILSYRGFELALSGDAEKTNESEFVQKVQNAKTDGITDKYDIFTDDYTVHAIKCGHHGSRTSTSQAYIDAITTPDGAKNAYYIISCGKGNTYKHPHEETLKRLAAMGVPDENILRTDIIGSIVLSVRADDNGTYGLYYGDKKTDVPATDPSKPDGSKTESEKVLVYRKLGGIRLTWGTVCWTCYAALVLAAVVHIFVVSVGGGRKNGGRKK